MESGKSAAVYKFNLGFFITHQTVGWNTVF